MPSAQQAAPRGLAAVAALALAAWYAPWLPALPSGLLDSNWALALGIACERGLHFGTDLVFAYGPAGCLATWQYWPATYLPGVAFWIGIGALSALLAVDAARAGREKLLALGAVAWMGLTPDTGLLVLPLAFVVHGWRTQRWTPAAWAAVLLMAPVALTKFTLLPICGLAVVAGTLLRDRGRLEPVIALPAFGLALAAVWTLMGQGTGNVLPYLLYGAEVARGYPQAMAWPGGRPALEVASLALSVAVTVAAVLVAAFVLAPRARSDLRPLARFGWWLFLLPVLLLVIRHATVRGDPGHLIIGFSFAGALGLMACGAVQARRRWLLMTVAACALGAVVMAQVAHLGRAGGLIAGRAEATARGLGSLLTLRDPRIGLDAALSRARGSGPGAEVQRAIGNQRFDVLGYDQHLVLDLPVAQWSPRPVLQSYSAYTPRLARLDADYVAGDAAPPWLLARVQTIDRRLPLMDDAFLWPQVRSRYDLHLRSGEHLLLKRAERPRAPAGARREANAVAADWVDVPALDGDTLHARIRPAAGFVSALRTALWKPPIRFLEVRTPASPEPQRFRLVPEIAAAGFVLSPLIQTSDELAAWLQGQPLPTAAVTRLRVVDEFGRPASADISFSNDVFSLP